MLPLHVPWQLLVLKGTSGGFFERGQESEPNPYPNPNNILI